MVLYVRSQDVLVPDDVLLTDLAGVQHGLADHAAVLLLILRQAHAVLTQQVVHGLEHY